ncbi:integrase arm-type DNA-binding domain-containing protein [Azoarcus sp. L1K30]|uniref:tyrosine-type recombinase/integrase n=1 Tax=Azoarcus sp. L1K30 TaxID=2820277 RepID=UPI001B812EED|nr:integrase arm-type DNA-binding domain-containing protein [Azoarcus sp. L1K30]MBR0568349.1 integrase arm-type DNA-binding domain-containing protein [Azoarcus sp. L1K30]
MPLTDVKIRQAKAVDKPIKLTDGAGLYLEVRPNGSKLWRYRYKIAGKENLFALGDYPTVSLQDARRAREDARELVKHGLHPSHARQAEKARQVSENEQTFRAVSEEWIEKKRAGWSGYYLKQVMRGMESDVWPYIGRLPLRSISASHVLEVLNRVTGRGAETVAINLRQWCSSVFRYGVSTLRADVDPVAALKGAIIRPVVKNAQPMSRDQLKTFMTKLDQYGGLRTTALAIRLLLYTFVRTVEMRRGEWSEIHDGTHLWVIHGDKMKMGRTHIVPLSRQALEVLTELRRITGGGVNMFPNSRRPNDIMSATTINRAMEYLGVPFSGHDFRATASTHLYEMGWSSHVVEMQLAHAERNKAKAAYNHAQYLAERRDMMQAWADWLDAIREDPVTPSL